MPRFIQLVRSRLAGGQQQFTEHPTADLLSAFAEQSLSAPERAGVVSHLAKCPECRESLALSPSGSEEVPLVPRRALFPYWRWAAAAVVPLLVLVLFWRRSPVENPVIPMAAKTSPPMSQPVMPLQPHPSPAPPTKAMPIARKKLSNLPLSVRAPEVPKAEPPKLVQLQPPSLTIPSQSSQEVQSILPMDSPKLPQPQLSIARPASSHFRSAAAPRAPSPGFVSAFAPIVTGESIWAIRDAMNTNGTIEKSGDGGKTWQKVQVDDGSRFTALWSRGPEIWVGGEEGALFHSIDAGVTWTLVAVTSQDSRLMETITRIDSPVSGAVTLRIQSGGDWVSVDGGAHWVRR
jgi:hypothetical protein